MPAKSNKVVNQQSQQLDYNTGKVQKEGLQNIWFDASKKLYLKRKLRKKVFNPPIYAKVFLYVFFVAVIGCIYILYSHQHARNHHRIIHQRKVAHKKIIREKYKNSNKHMIGQNKSPQQKLSEVDILKYEMKKLQEENYKLKMKKESKDEL
jgi:hypothetical protein